MFGNGSRVRETIHMIFGSREEKSRGLAINNLMAAHIYENWGAGPAKHEPQKWSDFLVSNKQAAAFKR